MIQYAYTKFRILKNTLLIAGAQIAVMIVALGLMCAVGLYRNLGTRECRLLCACFLGALDSWLLFVVTAVLCAVVCFALVTVVCGRDLGLWARGFCSGRHAGGRWSR